MILLFRERDTYLKDDYYCIKVTRYQWYWHYDYKRVLLNSSLRYDSYMVKTQDLHQGDLRKLEVDLPLVIPNSENILFLISGGDVIHSFTVPRLGVKMDAVPGRLNQTVIQPLYLGKYYGQCREICGANHAFMPISVEVLPSGEIE